MRRQLWWSWMGARRRQHVYFRAAGHPVRVQQAAVVFKLLASEHQTLVPAVQPRQPLKLRLQTRHRGASLAVRHVQNTSVGELDVQPTHAVLVAHIIPHRALDGQPQPNQFAASSTPRAEVRLTRARLISQIYLWREQLLAKNTSIRENGFRSINVLIPKHPSYIPVAILPVKVLDACNTYR